MMMRKCVMATILFFMLMGSVLVETRPFGGLTKTEEKKLVAGFFDGLSLGSIKDSGPSPGKGHNFVDRIHTFRFVKHSGPSPGGSGH
ncbi:PAMP-induced secreted peptide 2 [Hirschfeldia incana]|nr:PAMP-induced secreted peptide 2 [Hirschfeldia incana]